MEHLKYARHLAISFICTISSSTLLAISPLKNNDIKLKTHWPLWLNITWPQSNFQVLYVILFFFISCTPGTHQE